MDPKHREELEHNDLAHFLTHFKEWWDKYQNPVLIAVLLVVGSFSIYTIITNNRAAARNAAWSDLANSTSPEALASVAATHDQPAVRNLAALRAADKLLQRVITGGQPNPADQQGADPAVVQNDSDPVADLREAGRLYQQVIADGDAHAVYHLNARLGLGAVAEAQQEWATAREQYQTILDTAGDHQPAIRGQAKTRLALLPRLEQPLVYAPAPANPEPTNQGTTGTGGSGPVIDEMLAPDAIDELMNSTPETSSDSEAGIETEIDNPGLDLDVDTDLDADLNTDLNIDPDPDSDTDPAPAAE